jgi:hypothetical protein
LITCTRRGKEAGSVCNVCTHRDRPSSMQTHQAASTRSPFLCPIYIYPIAVRLYKAAATASRALAAALAFPRASLAGADRSRRARAPPAARLNLPTRSAARARRRHHQLHQVKPHTRRRFPSPLRHQSVAVAVDASCRVVIAAGEM